jgi:AbrB family looped-hinge helix DNA binding protein
MKTETLQIDGAGRVVLPKPLREHFNLVAGDKLKLSVEGNTIRLEPANSGAEMVREGTVMVFTGEFAESITTRKVEEMLARDREERLIPAKAKVRKK